MFQFYINTNCFFLKNSMFFFIFFYLIIYTLSVVALLSSHALTNYLYKSSRVFNCLFHGILSGIPPSPIFLIKLFLFGILSSFFSIWFLIFLNMPLVPFWYCQLRLVLFETKSADKLTLTGQYDLYYISFLTFLFIMVFICFKSLNIFI